MGIKTALLLYGAIALALLAVAAEPAAELPLPADPEARVPGTAYESAFSGYRTYREEKLAPWRDVNDEVRRAGGHINIMRAEAHGTREGVAAEAGSPSQRQSPPAPMQDAAGAPATRSAPRLPGHFGH